MNVEIHVGDLVRTWYVHVYSLLKRPRTQLVTWCKVTFYSIRLSALLHVPKLGGKTFWTCMKHHETTSHFKHVNDSLYSFWSPWAICTAMDHLETLRVGPDASPSAIERAFRKRTKALVAAKEALLNEHKRRKRTEVETPKMGFGKFKEWRIDEVIDEHENYCRWLVDQYQKNDDDCLPELKAAAKWILRNRPQFVMEMGFGKYQYESKDWVIENDPGYTIWALDTWQQNGSESGFLLVAFAKYAVAVLTQWKSAKQLCTDTL